MSALHLSGQRVEGDFFVLVINLQEVVDLDDVDLAADVGVGHGIIVVGVGQCGSSDGPWPRPDFEKVNSSTGNGLSASLSLLSNSSCGFFARGAVDPDIGSIDQPGIQEDLRFLDIPEIAAFEAIVLDVLDVRLHLAFICWRIDPARLRPEPAMGGVGRVGALDDRLVEIGIEHAGFEVVDLNGFRHTPKKVECRCMALDECLGRLDPG